MYSVSFITKTFHAVIKEHNSILKANYINVTSMFFILKKVFQHPKSGAFCKFLCVTSKHGIRLTHIFEMKNLAYPRFSIEKARYFKSKFLND